MKRVLRGIVPWAALVVFGCLAGAAEAQERVTQQYGRWVAKRNELGETYYESIYQAWNARGEQVRRDQVWYFPNDPRGRDTDKSNWWVYWYNPSKEVFWGRCPTPKHPNYAGWKEEKGVDLWQIIPQDARRKGIVRVSDVSRSFGGTISSEETGLPRISADLETVIDCVDFTATPFI